jgi:hypothetical protein
MSKPGVSRMMIGGGAALIGGLITLATYSAASGGGTYVVFYGAIGFGALNFAVPCSSRVTP